jgi:hypothetical protein
MRRLVVIVSLCTPLTGLSSLHSHSLNYQSFCVACQFFSRVSRAEARSYGNPAEALRNVIAVQYAGHLSSVIQAGCRYLQRLGPTQD